MSDLLAGAYVGLLAICTFYVLFVLLPTFFGWLLLPEERVDRTVDDHMTEMDRAMYEARKELGAALVPVLEQFVVRLSRILDRR